MILTYCLCDCTGNKQGNQDTIEKYTYPNVIDSLHIRGVYDSSMWFMYCYHSDLLCRTEGTDIKDSALTFGQCDLRLLSAIRHGDTVNFTYGFYYKNLWLPYVSKNGQEILSGMNYDIRSGAILSLVGHGWEWYYEGIKKSSEHPRIANPLQKDVDEYIRANANKLSFKFYHLAKQHMSLN